MKKLPIITMVILAIAASVFANPIPEPLILEFSCDPPWIEIFAPVAGELVGTTFRTTGGEVTITAADTNGMIAVLDSSNTTGFVLNPEGDSIIFPFEGWPASQVGYGIYGGDAGAPLPGMSIATGYYQAGPDTFYYYEAAYDFCFAPSPGTWNWRIYAGALWGRSKLIINEVYIKQGSTPIPDFIELYNAGNQVISADNLLLIGNTVFEFPAGLTIMPGEYYTIDRTSCPEFFNFNPDRDMLYLARLFNSYESLYSVVDQVGWSSNCGQDISLIRYPDGDVDWTNRLDFMGYNDETSYTFENGDPTPGAPNMFHVGIDEESLPGYIGYLECYPNPFNARTTISFSLAAASRVNLSIYDITGRLVEVLADQSYQIGEHSLIWDAGEYPTGVYFAYLNTGRNSLNQRVVLLK